MSGGGTGFVEEIASFTSCTRTELSLLSFIGAEMAAPAGTVVVSQNEPGREAYVITKGRAVVLCEGEPVGTLGQGEFFSEMSLLTGSVHPTTVIAETDMELIVLTPGDFDSLLANAPSVVRKMIRPTRKVAV